MDNKTKTKTYRGIGANFFVEFWEESWTYIKTVVDVLREPVLILDKNFRVLAANEAFYELFKVDRKNTEGKIVYKLGNGQWDIPSLRKLLEEILPNETFFKGFEVKHKFPNIGQRTFVLNARHIQSKDKTTSELFPPIIMLAMEDITEILTIASELAQYTKQLEKTMATKTRGLETKVSILEKTVKSMKKSK